MMNSTKTRCQWVTSDPLYIEYHDTEWGVQQKDDRLLFEHLCLEVNQAGLSWLTVLKKRERYREVFYNFVPEKVARITDKQVEVLLKDSGIIRNRSKINAMINNARCFLAVQEEFGSFYDYSLQFIGGARITNTFKCQSDIPVKTAASEVMSKDLKKRGFKFVGPTTIYAHMQAIGMVNDHLTSCFRYGAV